MNGVTVHRPTTGGSPTRYTEAFTASGASEDHVITHNKGTKNVIVGVIRDSDDKLMTTGFSVVATDTNTVTITAAFPAGNYSAIVI